MENNVFVSCLSSQSMNQIENKWRKKTTSSQQVLRIPFVFIVSVVVIKKLKISSS